MVPLTSWLGVPLRRGSARSRLCDVVADIGGPIPVVTGLVTGTPTKRRFVPWEQVDPDPATGTPVAIRRDQDDLRPGAHEVLLARDVLDGRVYDISRRRMVRVAEVWLDVRDGAANVAGVEVGARAALRRLRPRGLPSEVPPTSGLLRLDDLHLTTPHGHGAQLATDSAPVHRLVNGDLAHLLTHLPTSQAADIARRTSEGRLRTVLRRLHPRVRATLLRAVDQQTGGRGTPRTRRTDGWRLYPPKDTGNRR